jgi:microcystin-dependent protein
MGQKIGTETETLTIGQIPSHDHTTTSCGASQPYASSTTDAVQIANVGGGQAHNNMPPFQVVNYVIALEGLYPSRN